MKNHCGTIVLVLLVIFIFCSNSYAAEQEPSQKQAKSMPWLSLLLKTDYSVNFSKLPVGAPEIINNIYQPGSKFSLAIFNTSTRIFNLTRAELRNGSSIIGYTINPALLNGGQLNPGEFVNVGFTIRVPVPVKVTKFIYYLDDQITGSSFTVSHEY